MPIDPDQDDRVDIELTDELPVLIDTAVFESDKHLAAIAEDDESGHTARLMALVSEESDGVEVLKKDLEQRAAKIESLERELARLSERWLEIERHLNEKDAEIGRLRGALEAATLERHNVEEALTAAIAERETRIARLLDQADVLGKETAEARTEVERLRQQREVERREITALRAELESEVARRARDAQQRSRALEKPTPEALRQILDTPSAPRADAGSEASAAPALICLTGEGPRPFALAKGTITIGRSSECDIQILTHFVSREHARLTVSPLGGVLIEDLGSTNGVYVNSVRIDRQELRHGDVVTVGESQFRFLETMAH